jgi:DNA polymerase elongation subunit (family B)
MSYISAQLSQNKSQVLVWERNEKGERIVQRYKTPLYFYMEDKDGNHSSIFGKKLRKVTFDNYNEFYQTKQGMTAKNVALYESDIRAEYKVLSEHYYNKPVTNLHITFLDIEVDYDPKRGMAVAENAYAPISAISIFHQYSGRKLVFAVPPKEKNWSDEELDKLRTKAEIIICKNEKELLKLFLEEIYDSDVLSHWNGFGYDMPYLYERLMRVFNKDVASLLSFDEAKAPYYKEALNKFKIPFNKLMISGRISLDYMELFIKFAPSALDSNALEAVAEAELPHLPKLSYEGSLYNFYNEKFVEFVEYNIRDTEILEGLEKKFGYVSLAIQMSHMNTAMIDDVLGTVKITEMAIINHCHHDRSLVVPDSKKSTGLNEKFKGAFVLQTIMGLHKWVASIDVQSLYPSVMRTLNISPEMVVGQFYDKFMAFEHIQARNDTELTILYENSMTETKTAAEWADYLVEANWAVSGYGTVFDQKSMGIIPSILTKWFNERKEFKSIAGQYKGIDNEKYSYYDRLQTIKKLSLNSTYGACGNEFFRFFDVRLAESTTRSGQAVLNHMIRTIALKLDGTYQYPSPSIILGDTDSCYFLTGAENADDGLFVGRYIQKVINEAIPLYSSKNFLIKQEQATLIRVEQEIVADAGIAVAKKNYVFHLVYKDGKPVDEMKVTGLQIKKSTIPKPIRKKLLPIVEKLLKTQDWKQMAISLIDFRDYLMDEEKITEIGLPKMVKKVEEYTQHFENKVEITIPGHVQASIFWNKCLEKYEDHESFKIVSGTKIKVFYLSRKIDNFKAIAVPTDLKDLPQWFSEHIYAMIDKEAQVKRLVDKPFGAILKALGERMPTRKSLAIDEVFE